MMRHNRVDIAIVLILFVIDYNLMIVSLNNPANLSSAFARELKAAVESYKKIVKTLLA